MKRSCTNYIDDYFGAASSKAQATEQFNDMIKTLRQLGFTIAEEKCIAPTKQLTYLGIEIDTSSPQLIIRLPASKLHEFTALLAEWLQKSHCTLQELQSLAGKLVWASNVVRQGRVFLCRIFASIGGRASTDRLSSHSHSKRLISNDVKQDIKWWYTHMQFYNGIKATPESVFISRSDASLCTDASGSGFGATLGTSPMYWLAGDWTNEELHLFTNNKSSAAPIDISQPVSNNYESSDHSSTATHQTIHRNNLSELMAIGHAITSFGAAGLLKGQKIVIRSDNQAAVHALRNGKCSNADLAMIARAMHHVAATYSFEFIAAYIQGSLNTSADMLSRRSIQSFLSLNSQNKPQPNPVPICRLNYKLFK